jgi:hypothetical protein
MCPLPVASRAAPLISLLLLLGTSAAAAAENEAGESSSSQRRRRRLGDVSTLVNSNKWLEFDTNSTIDSFAFPCSTGCSNASSSLALATTAAPWTYTSLSCTQLTVLQGYNTGDSIYQVSDGNTVLGSTSLGTAGTNCTFDPTACFAGNEAGRFQTTLAKGNHSILIQVKFQNTTTDGGWFMLNTTACPPSKAPTKAPTKTPTKTPTKAPTKTPTKAPTKSPDKSPTKSPTKTPTKSPTKAPTKAPVQQSVTSPTRTPTKAPTKVPTKSPNTSPTKAPTKKPTKSPSATNSPSSVKCISALKCARLILTDKLCTCNQAIAGNKGCVKNKAKSQCCPDGRDKDYAGLVFKKFLRRCHTGLGIS